MDKDPNWQGSPLPEIDLLISVQALGPWALCRAERSWPNWPLLVTDLPFLPGQLSG